MGVAAYRSMMRPVAQYAHWARPPLSQVQLLRARQLQLAQAVLNTGWRGELDELFLRAAGHLLRYRWIAL